MSNSIRFMPMISKPIPYVSITGRPAYTASMQELETNFAAGCDVVRYLKKLTQSNRRQR